jgi:replicative DNA helicase
MSRSLKRLARDLNIPIVALAQLNRGVEGRQDKHPMLSDLRESGAIEQDADVVLGLFRADYYDPNSPDAGTLEISVLKNRAGATGTSKFAYDPAMKLLADLAEGQTR